jgi:hypothetical protein
MGKKLEKINNAEIVNTILLNRILQTEKSPARKTQSQIAKKCKCDVRKVVRAEQIICELLRKKVSVLSILINIK